MIPTNRIICHRYYILKSPSPSRKMAENSMYQNSQFFRLKIVPLAEETVYFYHLVSHLIKFVLICVNGDYIALKTGKSAGESPADYYWRRARV